MERAWVGKKGDARAEMKGFPTAAPLEQGRVWKWGFYLAVTKGVSSVNLKAGPMAGPKATLGAKMGYLKAENLVDGTVAH